MGDVFQKVNAGDKIKLSAVGWNSVMDVARAFQRGEYGGGKSSRTKPETSTEVHVRNDTGSDVGQFAVLAVSAPLITQADSAATFYESRSMVGSTPAAAMAFVVTQEPIGDGRIGRATLLGLTPCQVNLTDTSHRYADCSSSTTELTSAVRGPARILWCESDFDATGVQWAVVVLGSLTLDQVAWVSASSSTVIAGAVRGYRRINDGLVADWGYAALVWIQSVNGTSLPLNSPMQAIRNLSSLDGDELWDVEYCCAPVETGCDDTDFPDTFCVQLTQGANTCYVPIYRSGTSKSWAGVLGDLEVSFYCDATFDPLLYPDGVWFLRLDGVPTIGGGLSWSGGPVTFGAPFPASAFPATASLDAGVNTTNSCATQFSIVDVTIGTDMSLCGGSGSGGACPDGMICNACQDAAAGGTPEALNGAWTATSGSCGSLTAYAPGIVYDSSSGTWLGFVGRAAGTIRLSCVDGVWSHSFSDSRFHGGTIVFTSSPWGMVISGVTFDGCPGAVLTLSITP